MEIKSVFGRDITNGEYFTDEMIQSYNDVFYSQTSEGMLWTDESTGNTLVYFKEKPHNQFVLGFVITTEGELYQIGVAKPYVIEKGELFQEIHKNGIANMKGVVDTPEEPVVDPEPVEPIDPIEPTKIVVNVARDTAMSDVFTYEDKVYFFNETKYESTDLGDIEIRVYFNQEFNTYLELWLTEEPVVEPTEPEVPVDPEPSKPYGDEILEDIITINRPNPVAVGEWIGFENADWEVVEVVNDVLFIAKKAGEEIYRAFRLDFSEPVTPEPVEEIKLNGIVINPEKITDEEIRENLVDLISKLEKLSFRKEKGIDIYQVIEYGVELNILKATNYFVVGETGAIVAKKFNFDLPGDLIMITAMLENDIAEFVQAHAPIEVEEPVDHLVSIEDEITY